MEAAAWAITPSGAQRGGAGAITTALDALLPGGLPLLHSLYRLPGLRQAADAGYRWLARNRGRLPGGPSYLNAHGGPPLLDPATRAELQRRRIGGS